MSEIINGGEVDRGDIDLTELVTFEKGVEVSSGYGYTIDGDNALSFPVDNTNVAIGPLAGDALTGAANSNVAIGYQACLYNETGSFNTLVGREAGFGVTGNSFSANTFIGFRAGYFTTTGGQNTFLGYQAGAIHNTGVDNVFLGYEAGYYNETGDNNVAIGKDAGLGATGQSYSNNVFVGYQAGYAVTTGSNNLFLGSSAALSNTTGYKNIAIGEHAIRGNETGGENVAVGYRAGYGTVGQTHAKNTFVGYQCGYSVTTGGENVIMGHQALFYNQTGAYNVAIGVGAGYGASGQNHSNNVFVGYQAGYSMTTGAGNIFIGYQAGYSETGSNKLYIDNSNTTTPLIYAEFDNDLVRINGDLEVTGSFPALTNLLTNAGFGVWSNSTLENVGSDLVTNGGFDSDATGWTAVDATLASIAGGQAGNCLEVTRTGAAEQGAYHIFTTEVGKLYKATMYVKSGTSGNEGFYIKLTNSTGGTILARILGTSSGAWVQYEGVFEATTTTSRIYLLKNSATAGTMLFDTATCHEATPGCVAADILGPDGWDKVETLGLYREHNGSNTKDGEFYSLKMVPSAQDDWIRWPGGYFDSEEHYKKFAGRTVTFGAWVKTSTASDIFIRINDGISLSDGSYHTGGGDWEWLEVTKSMSSNADRAVFQFRQNNATPGTAYISQPMLVFGKSIGEGNYVPRPEETIYIETRIGLTDYSGDTISADATINLEAQSDGKIPKGAKAVECGMEGRCSTIEKNLSLFGSPTLPTLKMYSQVADKFNSNGGVIGCDSNGDIEIARNDTFDDVYIRISGVQLR